MLIEFKSVHNREAKTLYKRPRVSVPRPLRILESGEIRHYLPPGRLSSTLHRCSQRPCNYCSDTIVATRSGLCNFCFSLIPILSFFLLLSSSQLMLLCFFQFLSPKWPFLTFLRIDTSSIRIFKIYEFPNPSAFTIRPIVRITLLFLHNRQFGSFAAKNSKLLRLHFGPFWSNVTYSPDSPVNVLIESRNVCEIGTVSSNRIYKMHEITFIRVISTH